MRSIKALALGCGIALAAASGAVASPITTGTLGMSFTYQAEDIAGNNVALGSAVAIDFSALNGGAPSAANTGSFNVLQATGSFGANGVAIGQVGTIRDLVFNPFAAITPFFTIGTVNFNLTSLVVSTQTNMTLGLVGSGNFVVGTDVTSGTWSFSGQTTGSDLTGTFSWSADASPTVAVPEPATLALLGTGLLGLVLVRRRRRNAT